MTNRTYLYRESVSGIGTLWERQGSIVSDNSPWSNGVLLKRQNRLNQTREEWRSTLTGYKFNNPADTRVFKLNAWTLSTYNSPWLEHTDLIDECVRKWYGKAGGFVTNLAEMYATRKQTIDMCRKTVARLYYAIKEAKRFNWRGICRHLGINIRRPKGWKGKYYTPDELWLEYVYGWKPLLGDVYNLTNAEFRAPYKVVETSLKVHFEKSQITTGSSMVQRMLGEQTFRVKVVGTLTATGLAYATASQLGVTNPLSLAWELLPWSFVVDWFVGIGSYLEQLTALNGVQISNASVTTMRYQPYGTTALSRTDGLLLIGTPHKYGTVSVKNRSTSMPAYPLPVIKNPLSLVHFANALALLTGALKGTKLGKSRLS